MKFEVTKTHITIHIPVKQEIMQFTVAKPMIPNPNLPI